MIEHGWTRFLWTTGSTEAVLNAIEWALKSRADVISMSLGVDCPGNGQAPSRGRKYTVRLLDLALG